MLNLESIIQQLPRYKAEAGGVRDVVLADLVMIGEKPAPTFREEARIQFISNRFNECGLQNCSVDEKGNGIGVLPGTEGKQNVLLVTNADSLVEDTRDQTIEISAERAIGPFVGDNSIALAVLTVLPLYLERLQIRFKSNLVFLASTRSLGRGNLEGIRFFLANASLPVHVGLCLESVQLGRLNYSCMGMLRGDIHCRLPDNYNWAQFGTTGTVIPMSDVIRQISEIPLPHRPLTSMILGSIQGGISYGNVARETVLGFEIRSESSETLNQLKQQIEDITEEATAKTGTRFSLDLFAQREPGGLDIGHPLVRNARAVVAALGLQPMLYATTSQLSALKDSKVPGLTLGITTGERRNELDEIDESVAIEPISTGLAQFVGVLQSIDEGLTAS